jgi:hypothetical protein
MGRAIGNWRELPFKRPFIAAASNLRYGRDLNFYCCFRTHLRAEDIGVQRRKARDRWEVANLVFLRRNCVSVRAIRSGQLGRNLSKRARHLVGALYAWAVYANRVRRAGGMG